MRAPPFNPGGDEGGGGRSANEARPGRQGPYADFNREILELAAKYGLRTRRHPDGEIVILGRQVRKARGFWFIVSLTRSIWGFYHPGRPSPRADIKALKKIAPDLDDWSCNNRYPGPGRRPPSAFDELLLHSTRADALKLMFTGPKYTQAQRLRPDAEGHVPDPPQGPDSPQLDEGGSGPETPDHPPDGPEVPPAPPEGSARTGTEEDPGDPGEPGRGSP